MERIGRKTGEHSKGCDRTVKAKMRRVAEILGIRNL